MLVLSTFLVLEKRGPIKSILCFSLFLVKVVLDDSRVSRSHCRSIFSFEVYLSLPFFALCFMSPSESISLRMARAASWILAPHVAAKSMERRCPSGLSILGTRYTTPPSPLTLLVDLHLLLDWHHESSRTFTNEHKIKVGSTTLTLEIDTGGGGFFSRK